MNDWDRIVESFNTHEWRPEKDRTAILLIDCQEYFRDMISPILKNITNVIDSAHRRDVPLFFTRHGHSPIEEPGVLGEWWADIIVEGSKDSQLLEELRMRREDAVIEKDRYSAFYKTDLEEQLREKDIRDLVIGGVMTNLCCETSARDAFVRDFRVFFLADGTSTATPEFHLATLRNLSYGFATLMTCEQVIHAIHTK